MDGIAKVKVCTWIQMKIGQVQNVEFVPAALFRGRKRVRFGFDEPAGQIQG